MKQLPPLFNIDRIINYCQGQDETNNIILTPNNRLRNKVIEAWGDHQQNQGLNTWKAPNVFSLEQWVSEKWLKLQATAYPNTDAVVINTEQQRILWEQITKDCGLMQTERVAADALSAFRLLEQWDLSINKTLAKELPSTFIEWTVKYQQQLNMLGMITAETRYIILNQAFKENALPPQEKIYLLGFDDLAPIIHKLLQNASDELTHLPSEIQKPKSLQRVECDSYDDEIRVAAKWAYDILEKDPQVRIGIIVPTLISYREKVQQLLAAELEPQFYDNGTQPYTLPFNISAGVPLANTPLIASTLNLLTLQNKEWDTEFICQCLLSPFWGNYSEELSIRVELTDKLRDLNRFKISGTTLRELSQNLSNKENLTIYQYFYSLSEHNPTQRFNFSDKKLPSQWVTHFLNMLEILKWPGERTPNSQEYQQTQLWHQLLEHFTQLDNTLGEINRIEAIKQLHSIAARLPFQEKVIDSPIQVLGILEGAGLNFTHCWITGMDQQSWPPAPKPNPFLPVYLQREHEMPHSSSTRELKYAQSLTAQYRHSAENIIFSSANYNSENEQTLEASLLISDIPLTPLESITVNEKKERQNLYHWQNRMQDNHNFEIINCQKGPNYTESHLKSGINTLKEQAHNPFDAFVKYRLKANPYNEPVNGFSALDKGNILHHSLANIWKNLKTHEKLNSTDQKSLDKLIQKNVKQSVKEIQKKNIANISDTLCHIEIERQSHIIQQWLLQEKQRPPFTVIAIEESQQITFDGITMDIRIDRVDQLSDGSFLIIDYKTGKANTASWAGDRLKEPQLPLYALSYGHTVSGISFASINIEEQRFYGLTDNDTHEQAGITSSSDNRYFYSSWQDTLENWQEALQKLLTEFQQGVCSIEYLDGSPSVYAKEYLSINRYYEAESIQRFIDKTKQ